MPILAAMVGTSPLAPLCPEGSRAFFFRRHPPGASVEKGRSASVVGGTQERASSPFSPASSQSHERTTGGSRSNARATGFASRGRRASFFLSHRLGHPRSPS